MTKLKQDYDMKRKIEITNISPEEEIECLKEKLQTRFILGFVCGILLLSFIKSLFAIILR